MTAVDIKALRAGTGCSHSKVMPLGEQAVVYRPSAIVGAVNEFLCVTMALASARDHLRPLMPAGAIRAADLESDAMQTTVDEHVALHDDRRLFTGPRSLPRIPAAVVHRVLHRGVVRPPPPHPSHIQRP